MIATRLATYYGVIFFVIGIMLPFWPLWMQARGLSPEDIGIVMGVGMLMKIVANPVIAGYADRTGTRRKPLIFISGIAALTFSCFWLAQSFWPILIVTMAFFLFWSPIIPLTESLAMHHSKIGAIDYGRVRLWGSLTFVIAAIGGGWLLTGQDRDLIYLILLVGTTTVVISALMLPDRRLPASHGKHSFSPFLSVLKDSKFIYFIIATGLLQTSHIIYYAFGTIHWQKAGHSEVVIGWLWAEGVIAEVFVFILGTWLIKKIGPTRLIALAGLAGMIRWWGTGTTDALSALLFLQILHGATFGATHLGAIYFIAQRMNTSISATAQSIYAAAVSGIGFSIASLISGHLYVALGSAAYFPMAAMAGVGGLVAFQLGRPRSSSA